MTRAVIKLARDINEAMPKLNRVLNGCGYDPANNYIGFRVEDYSVIINNKEMLIIGAENEMQATAVLKWLNNKINGDDSPPAIDDRYMYHNKLG